MFLDICIRFPWLVAVLSCGGLFSSHFVALSSPDLIVSLFPPAFLRVVYKFSGDYSVTFLLHLVVRAFQNLLLRCRKQVLLLDQRWFLELAFSFATVFHDKRLSSATFLDDSKSAASLSFVLFSSSIWYFYALSVEFLDRRILNVIVSLFCSNVYSPSQSSYWIFCSSK